MTEFSDDPPGGLPYKEALTALISSGTAAELVKARESIQQYENECLRTGITISKIDGFAGGPNRHPRLHVLRGQRSDILKEARHELLLALNAGTIVALGTDANSTDPFQPKRGLIPAALWKEGQVIVDQRIPYDLFWHPRLSWKPRRIAFSGVRYYKSYDITPAKTDVSVPTSDVPGVQAPGESSPEHLPAQKRSKGEGSVKMEAMARRLLSDKTLNKSMTAKEAWSTTHRHVLEEMKKGGRKENEPPKGQGYGDDTFNKIWRSLKEERAE